MTTPPRPHFPPPSSISPEAQQMLANPMRVDAAPDPDPSDISGLERWIEAKDDAVRAMFAGVDLPEEVLARSEIEINGVTTFVLRPADLPDDATPPIVVELHGGGCSSAAVSWRGRWRPVGRSAAGRSPGCPTTACHHTTDIRQPWTTPSLPIGARSRSARRARSRSSVRQPAATWQQPSPCGQRTKGWPCLLRWSCSRPELDLTESGDTFATLLGVDTMLGLLAGANR